MTKKRRLKTVPTQGGPRLKEPTSAAGGGNDEHPAFCFRHMHPDYCISRCEPSDQLAFVERARKLATMTWQQIKFADRHGFGAEKIARTSIRKPIPDHVTEDVPLLALRFSGKKPMVGYREDRIFCVLYFDRDFSVYKH